MGRLHTRYAPVRRSPPVYCYTVLPLDLHVLGLPLAFILSQDQTLHCKKMFCYKSLALISKVLFEITLLQEWKKLLAAQILQRTLFKYIAIKNNFFLFAGSVLAAFPVVPTADFSAESGAKISHLFETTKSFRKIFSEIFRTFFLIVSNRISYSKRVQR